MPTKFNENLTWLNLFKKAFGEYKSEIILLAVLSFFSGFLESIGINAVIPLFSFLSKDQAAGADFISRAIENFFLYAHLEYTMASLLVFIISLFIIKAAALFWANYVAARTTAAFETKTRNELFSATLKADWPYLSEQKVGYLDQTLTNDVDQSSKLLSYISYSIIVFANLITYGFLIVNISWVVALFTLVFGGAVLLALKPLFNKNTAVSEAIGKLYKELAHYVNENVLGMKTVKAAFVEENVLKRSNKYFEEIKSLNLRVTALRNATTVLIQPVGLIFVIAVFAFFYKMTVFNFASFAVIVYAINKIFAFIQQAQSNLHTIHAQVPYLLSVLKYKNEAKKHEEYDLGTAGFHFQNKLEFKNVDFSYKHREQGVLKNVSFSVKKGEMVGLIGPSGAGKTTVVDLILRLYLPQKGAILLDEKEISDIRMENWRKNIGYVSQEIFLLNDTIENNIKFYSGAVTEKDIIEAARMANIDDFINSLPEKFATVVGERGILLSGGQRQRIILARVLARRPQVLILDEATSALDNESEILIQEAIDGLKGKVTVLAIAHRLSTVKASDKLIVLDDGKIIEEDSPEELLKNKDSYFFKVYNLRT
ncbi:MAG: ABC transporter ATP-binding protein [Candidatus Giovannonibacteria bacterium]|nr:ABC transporter ATP-binding protein [Candidatus Giovannonibacteria bacterium]